MNVNENHLPLYHPSPQSVVRQKLQFANCEHTPRLRGGQSDLDPDRDQYERDSISLVLCSQYLGCLKADNILDN